MEQEQRLVNRQKKLTRVGRTAHTLVLAEVLLHNNTNPEITFAMSEDMVAQYTVKRDEAIQTLGLPEEGRQEKIDSLRQQLAAEGYPHWKSK